MADADPQVHRVRRLEAQLRKSEVTIKRLKEAAADLQASSDGAWEQVNKLEADYHTFQAQHTAAAEANMTALIRDHNEEVDELKRLYAQQRDESAKRYEAELRALEAEVQSLQTTVLSQEARTSRPTSPSHLAVPGTPESTRRSSPGAKRTRNLSNPHWRSPLGGSSNGAFKRTASDPVGAMRIVSGQDPEALLKTIKTLEEENHWMQRSLADVRQKNKSKNPTYDGQSPALLVSGQGRWTEQRAQDRADRDEMSAIQLYFRDQGLPPESSGYQQILFLWRRSVALQDSNAEITRRDKHLQREIEAHQDMVEACKQSSKAARHAKAEARALARQVEDLQVELRQLRSARIAHAEEMGATGERLRDMIAKIRSEHDEEVDQMTNKFRSSASGKTQEKAQLMALLDEAQAQCDVMQRSTASLRDELAETRGQLSKARAKHARELLEATSELERLEAQQADQLRQSARQREELAKDKDAQAQALLMKTDTTTKLLHAENESLKLQLEDAKGNMDNVRKAADANNQELQEFKLQFDQHLTMLQGSLAQQAEAHKATLEQEQHQREGLEQRARDLVGQNERIAHELQRARAQQEQLEVRLQEQDLRHQVEINEGLVEKEAMLKELMRASAAEIELEQLATERERLGRTLETTTKDAEMLAETCVDYEAQLAKLTRDRELHEARLGEAQDALGRAEEQSKKAQDELESTLGHTSRALERSKEQALAEVKAHFETELKILATERDLATEAKQVAEEHVEELEREVEETTLVLKERQQALVRDLKAARQGSAGLEESVSRAFAKVKAFPGEDAPALHRPEEQVQYLVSLLEKRALDVDAVRNLVTSQQNDRRTLQEQLVKMDSETRQLRTQAREANQRLAEQRSDALHSNTKVAQDARNLRRQVQDKQTELSEVQYLLQAKSKDSERLRAENKEMTVRVGLLTREREFDREQRQQAEKELKDTREDLLRLKTKQLEIEVENSKLQGEARQQGVLFEAMRGTREQAEGDREALHRKIAQLTEELQRANEKLLDTEVLGIKVADLQAARDASAQEAAQYRSQVFSLHGDLDEERQNLERQKLKLSEELVQVKSQLGRQERSGSSTAADLQRQIEVLRARAGREAEARVAADATARQLREENQRLLAQLEGTHQAVEEGIRRRAQLEGVLKDKDRELVATRQNLGTLGEDVTRLRLNQTLMQERARLDQSRLMTDVKREIDAQSSAMRDIERLRGETLGGRERDHTRKLATISSEVRRLGNELRQERFDKEVSLLSASTPYRNAHSHRGGGTGTPTSLLGSRLDLSESGHN